MSDDWWAREEAIQNERNEGFQAGWNNLPYHTSSSEGAGAYRNASALKQSLEENPYLKTNSGGSSSVSSSSNYTGSSGSGLGGLLIGLCVAGGVAWLISHFINHSNYPPSSYSPAPPRAAPAQPNAVTIYATVNTERLNMRSCPQTSCAVVTSFPRGTRVEITGNAQQGWVPVRAFNTNNSQIPINGWMSGGFLIRDDQRQGQREGQRRSYHLGPVRPEQSQLAVQRVQIQANKVNFSLHIG